MQKILTSVVGPIFIVAVTAIALWLFRESLFPIQGTAEHADSAPRGNKGELEVLELGSRARKNLNLVTKPARLTDYWRTITIPGEIQDRPGVSDRGVTSPAVGAVSQIHVYPGDCIIISKNQPRSNNIINTRIVLIYLLYSSVYKRATIFI